MAEIAKIKGYDIRDKKLADATSQSTVAATDAIEMKTTSGDQVYITRDSFVQAMASVLNSNSQSTLSQLFGADANGNHAAINLDNLASAMKIHIGGNDVFDSAPPQVQGIWVSKAAPVTNVPEGVSGGMGVTITFCSSGGSGEMNLSFQIAYFHYSTSCYVRYSYFGSGWYEWIKIGSTH